MSGKRIQRKRKNNARRIVTAILAMSAAVSLGRFAVCSLSAEAENALTEPSVSIKEEVVEEVFSYCEEVPLSYDLQYVLYEECKSRNVPLSIALGVINTESCFKVDARNGICYGLMQISEINKDRLLTEIGVDGIIEGDDNIRCGVYMLSELYNKYGDWNMALIAYNRGERGAQRDCFDLGIYSNAYTDKVNGFAEYWSGYIGESLY